MTIYVNRILNMKKIKAIGMDMDYTLIRYKTKAFESLAHKEALKKLVEIKKYPDQINDLVFDYDMIIQGLVIDRPRGNIIQVNRYGKVKIAYHGTKPMNYKTQKEIYGNFYIDLGLDQFESLDTHFAKSYGTIYAQLVELKSQGVELPDYETLSYDIKEMIDIIHADGTLKDQVQKDIEKYIIIDKEIVTLLERFKLYNKKVILITNSDYLYTNALLKACINPFLTQYKNWQDIFDFTITLANKPNFFQEKIPFLKIESESGLMSNTNGVFGPGVYQGGCGKILQDHLQLDSNEILYLGDHIYGDVVKTKKAANWRTALVLDSLNEEIVSIKKSHITQKQINDLMEQKEVLEYELNQAELDRHLTGKVKDKEKISSFYHEIETINSEISTLLSKYRNYFNPNWGEIMRAGQEESWFAQQVERYACIYMSNLVDLINFSPKTYFRPMKRTLPHEIIVSSPKKA